MNERERETLRILLAVARVEGASTERKRIIERLHAFAGILNASPPEGEAARRFREIGLKALDAFREVLEADPPPDMLVV